MDPRSVGEIGGKRGHLLGNHGKVHGKDHCLQGIGKDISVKDGKNFGDRKGTLHPGDTKGIGKDGGLGVRPVKVGNGDKSGGKNHQCRDSHGKGHNDPEKSGKNGGKSRFPPGVDLPKNRVQDGHTHRAVEQHHGADYRADHGGDYRATKHRVVEQYHGFERRAVQHRADHRFGDRRANHRVAGPAVTSHGILPGHGTPPSAPGVGKGSDRYSIASVGNKDSYVAGGKECYSSVNRAYGHPYVNPYGHPYDSHDRPDRRLELDVYGPGPSTKTVRHCSDVVRNTSEADIRNFHFKSDYDGTSHVRNEYEYGTNRSGYEYGSNRNGYGTNRSQYYEYGTNRTEYDYGSNKSEYGGKSYRSNYAFSDKLSDKSDLPKFADADQQLRKDPPKFSNAERAVQQHFRKESVSHRASNYPSSNYHRQGPRYAPDYRVGYGPDDRTGYPLDYCSLDYPDDYRNERRNEIRNGTSSNHSDYRYYDNKNRDFPRADMFRADQNPYDTIYDTTLDFPPADIPRSDHWYVTGAPENLDVSMFNEFGYYKGPLNGYYQVSKQNSTQNSAHRSNSAQRVNSTFQLVNSTMLLTDTTEENPMARKEDWEDDFVGGYVRTRYDPKHVRKYDEQHEGKYDEKHGRKYAEQRRRNYQTNWRSDVNRITVKNARNDVCVHGDAYQAENESAETRSSNHTVSNPVRNKTASNPVRNNTANAREWHYRTKVGTTDDEEDRRYRSLMDSEYRSNAEMQMVRDKQRKKNPCPEGDPDEKGRERDPNQKEREGDADAKKSGKGFEGKSRIDLLSALINLIADRMKQEDAKMKQNDANREVQHTGGAQHIITGGAQQTDVPHAIDMDADRDARHRDMVSDKVPRPDMFTNMVADRGVACRTNIDAKLGADGHNLRGRGFTGNDGISCIDGNDLEFYLPSTSRTRHWKNVVSNYKKNDKSHENTDRKDDQIVDADIVNVANDTLVGNLRNDSDRNKRTQSPFRHIRKNKSIQLPKVTEKGEAQLPKVLEETISLVSTKTSDATDSQYDVVTSLQGTNSLGNTPIRTSLQTIIPSSTASTWSNSTPPRTALDSIMANNGFVTNNLGKNTVCANDMVNETMLPVGNPLGSPVGNVVGNPVDLEASPTDSFPFFLNTVMPDPLQPGIVSANGISKSTASSNNANLNIHSNAQNVKATSIKTPLNSNSAQNDAVQGLNLNFNLGFYDEGRKRYDFGSGLCTLNSFMVNANNIVSQDPATELVNLGNPDASHPRGDNSNLTNGKSIIFQNRMNSIGMQSTMGTARTDVPYRMELWLQNTSRELLMNQQNSGRTFTFQCNPVSQPASNSVHNNPVSAGNAERESQNAETDSQNPFENASDSGIGDGGLGAGKSLPQLCSRLESKFDIWHAPLASFAYSCGTNGVVCWQFSCIAAAATFGLGFREISMSFLQRKQIVEHAHNSPVLTIMNQINRGNNYTSRNHGALSIMNEANDLSADSISSLKEMIREGDLEKVFSKFGTMSKEELQHWVWMDQKLCQAKILILVLEFVPYENPRTSCANLRTRENPGRRGIMESSSTSGAPSQTDTLRVPNISGIDTLRVASRVSLDTAYSAKTSTGSSSDTATEGPTDEDILAWTPDVDDPDWWKCHQFLILFQIAGGPPPGLPGADPNPNNFDPKNPPIYRRILIQKVATDMTMLEKWVKTRYYPLMYQHLNLSHSGLELFDQLANCMPALCQKLDPFQERNKSIFDEDSRLSHIQTLNDPSPEADGSDQSNDNHKPDIQPAKAQIESGLTNVNQVNQTEQKIEPQMSDGQTHSLTTGDTYVMFQDNSNRDATRVDDIHSSISNSSERLITVLIRRLGLSLDKQAVGLQKNLEEIEAEKRNKPVVSNQDSSRFDVREARSYAHTTHYSNQYSDAQDLLYHSSMAGDPNDYGATNFAVSNLSDKRESSKKENSKASGIYPVLVSGLGMVSYDQIISLIIEGKSFCRDDLRYIDAMDDVLQKDKSISNTKKRGLERRLRFLHKKLASIDPGTLSGNPNGDPNGEKLASTLSGNPNGKKLASTIRNAENVCSSRQRAGQDVSGNSIQQSQSSQRSENVFSQQQCGQQRENVSSRQHSSEQGYFREGQERERERSQSERNRQQSERKGQRAYKLPEGFYAYDSFALGGCMFVNPRRKEGFICGLANTAEKVIVKRLNEKGYCRNEKGSSTYSISKGEFIGHVIPIAGIMPVKTLPELSRILDSWSKLTPHDSLLGSWE